MDTTTRLMTGQFPFWTLLICAGALIIFNSPVLRASLIYDHSAIDSGEFWRLITGNLVHLSPAHLCYNLVAFLIAGTIIEVRGYRHFPMLCLSAATFISIILYFAEPAMSYYAGLSGVVTAAVTYLCLHGLTEKGVWSWLCATVLVGVTAKVGIELVFGKSFLSEVGAQEFVPVPLSHLIGIFTASLLFVVVRFLNLGFKAREM